MPIIDFVGLPIVMLGGLYLKAVRRAGMKRMPLSRQTLIGMGIFPIRDHYYEPLFNPKYLTHSLRDDRDIPGIDFNKRGQLELLRSFHYAEELMKFPMENTGDETVYYYNNDSYGLGDAEFLYSMIRKFKPHNIIEIGSGNSTLIAIEAVKKNKEEDAGYTCKHKCIEPYEMKWLENCEVEVIRKKLQDVDMNLFSSLGADDILFIDSSHIIRPQGDVVIEYLNILPILHKGVIVHIHDIFTPQDYCDEWVYEDVRFWNEQYMLEAFLSCNKEFEILAMVNYLKNKHFSLLAEKCPILGKNPEHEACAFWMRKVE